GRCGPTACPAERSAFSYGPHIVAACRSHIGLVPIPHAGSHVVPHGGSRPTHDGLTCRLLCHPPVAPQPALTPAPACPILMPVPHTGPLPAPYGGSAPDGNPRGLGSVDATATTASGKARSLSDVRNVII